MASDINCMGTSYWMCTHPPLQLFIYISGTILKLEMTRPVMNKIVTLFGVLLVQIKVMFTTLK